MQRWGTVSSGAVMCVLWLALSAFIPLQASAVTMASLGPNFLQTGPNIGWPPPPIPILWMDSAYTGQSHHVFEWAVWVNDSAGVDSVIFRFKWERDQEWLNRTASIISGNELSGRYKGNLTWNAPGGGVFQFKVFANDSLGQWNETIPMTVRFGYLYSDLLHNPQFLLLLVVLPTVSLLGLFVVWKHQRQQKLSI